MRNVLTLLGVALLTGTALNSGERLPFAIIVNKSNQLHDLSSAKIKLIFLRKISRWPWGAEILPVDLPDHTASRRAFVKSIMESTPGELEMYWIEQKVSRGLYPPARVADVQAAKMLVAARVGGVAYIPVSDVDDTVRALEVR